MRSEPDCTPIVVHARPASAISFTFASSTMRAPGYAMNILKLGEPSRISSSSAGKNSSGRSVMTWCRLQSTTAFSSARAYQSA